MTALTALLGRRRNPMMANMAARAGALASLALATLLVARIGGPSAVGVYVLLRILPGIVGLLVASGLPGAAPYFLAGPSRADPRLRGTLIALASLAGIVGTALWVISMPLLHRAFFHGVPPGAVALAGLTVLTQLLFASSKACLQGIDDLPGTNWAILLEEFLFVPAYVVLNGVGLGGDYAIVASLLIADVVPTVVSSFRLARRGFFNMPGRPLLSIAVKVSAFGARGQIGNLISLLNYRLDFVILGALSGPRVLGMYAVASKLAELLRVPSQALYWVLYPRFAQETAREAECRARRLIPRAGILVAAGAVPLALLAGFIVPAVYGEAFRPAIILTQILLLAVSAEGIAGVISAFLYGRGRPGLNSLATGGGLVVTVVLDLLLIPRYGAVGAAWASAAAYLSTAALLVTSFRHETRKREPLVAPVVDV
jgi:O-antigen/teichoic acid export membrane protein